jgi:hypothetical protein
MCMVLTLRKCTLPKLGLSLTFIDYCTSERRYTHRTQSRPHSETTSLPTNREILYLTAYNFALHKAEAGKPISWRQSTEKWLDGVREAMEKDELEDPMNNFWDLHSKLEDRVFGSEHRPEDEWDMGKRYINVRRCISVLDREPAERISER